MPVKKEKNNESRFTPKQKKIIKIVIIFVLCLGLFFTICSFIGSSVSNVVFALDSGLPESDYTTLEDIEDTYWKIDTTNLSSNWSTLSTLSPNDSTYDFQLDSDNLDLYPWIDMFFLRIYFVDPSTNLFTPVSIDNVIHEYNINAIYQTTIMSIDLTNYALEMKVTGTARYQSGNSNYLLTSQRWDFIQKDDGAPVFDPVMYLVGDPVIYFPKGFSVIYSCLDQDNAMSADLFLNTIKTLADPITRIDGSSTYDDGYADGYSAGQTSSLVQRFNLKNMIYDMFDSIVSFIPNALDIDFFGVNIGTLAIGLFGIAFCIGVLGLIWSIFKKL